MTILFQVYVIVTRTGFATKKGETVKFMLHPKNVRKFKFYSEAYTYIKIMGIIGKSTAACNSNLSHNWK